MTQFLPAASARLLAGPAARLAAPLAALVVLGAALLAAGGSRDRTSERGDVPGWVLITVMTAGLVSALWLVAGPQLEAMLSQALSSVSR